MTSLVCAYFVTVICLLLKWVHHSDSYFEDTIDPPLLLPPPGSAQSSLAFILLPESGAELHAYVPLVEAVKKTSRFRIWAAILNTTGSPQLRVEHFPYVIADALERLHRLGMRSTRVFLAAHGDSGFHIQLYTRLVPDIIRGVLLYSSYTDVHAHSQPFPVPLLVVSGELDDVIKIDGHVSAFKLLQKSSRVNFDAIYTQPVIILRHVKHNCMLVNDTGNGTVTVLSDRQDVIVKKYGEYSSAFIAHVLKSPNIDLQKDRKLLWNSHVETFRILQPFLEMDALCNHDDATSPWTQHSQVWLSGIRGRHTRHLRVTSHIIDSRNSSQPSLSANERLVTVTSFAHFVHDRSDKRRTRAPRYMLMRMTSPDLIRSLVEDVTNLHIDWTDGVSCKDLNYAAYVTAYRAASKNARSRFDSKHLGVIFNDDVIVGSEREWHERQLSVEHKGREAWITAIHWRTTLSYIPKSDAGLFYCKVLTPSRFLEWIYGDSL